MPITNLYSFVKRLQRSLIIWKTLFTLLIFLWCDNVFLKFFPKDSSKIVRNQEKRAKWFTNELINLGSAFIKIGQLLSARPDLIPKEWIKELTKLQDDVPQFSFKEVESIIKDELNTSFSKIDLLERKPIGSASLAQVHKAFLTDGKEVVFKVQRPNLRDLFITDLAIMQQIAFFMQKNKGWSRGRNWVEIAKECRKVLLR